MLHLLNHNVFSGSCCLWWFLGFLWFWLPLQFWGLRVMHFSRLSQSQDLPTAFLIIIGSIVWEQKSTEARRYFHSLMLTWLSWNVAYQVFPLLGYSFSLSLSIPHTLKGSHCVQTNVGNRDLWLTSLKEKYHINYLKCFCMRKLSLSLIYLFIQ